MSTSESIFRTHRPGKRPSKILIPLTPDCDHASLLQFAKLIAHSDSVLLLGIVPMAPGENLSEGVKPARELRGLIQEASDRLMIRAKPRVRVSDTPWRDIRDVLASEPSIELLALDWSSQLQMLEVSAKEIIENPPCDIALVRGPFPAKVSNVLVPMRGGPHAERAFRTALTLASPQEAEINTVRLQRPHQRDFDRRGFEGLAQVIAEIPNAHHKTIVSENWPETLLDASKEYDIVVLGTAAKPPESSKSFGEVTDALLNKASSAVIAVKTKRDVPIRAEMSSFGREAISVLVDQWFAENTFHADEFSCLERLAFLKEERGLSISLALPTLNEEKTVGYIIEATKKQMMDQFPLLDEIVLIDSQSSDRTREIAADQGIPVHIHQEILPQYGARRGKGEALWKSLYVTSGDIVIWVDTDISNFDLRFVYGLIGPLLHRPSLGLVKGFYRRPIKTASGLQSVGGGRVTELTSRPLLNLFYPELSGIIQPLSGEYGGRREVLEQLEFTSGYGVETCVLIDTFEKFKLASIAQVDMIERIHNNQSLRDLSKMSFAITQTVIARLEKRYGQAMLQDINRSMKLIRNETDRFFLEIEEIAELGRPPMIDIPEYQARRQAPPISTYLSRAEESVSKSAVLQKQVGNGQTSLYSTWPN